MGRDVADPGGPTSSDLGTGRGSFISEQAIAPCTSDSTEIRQQAGCSSAPRAIDRYAGIVGQDVCEDHRPASSSDRDRHQVPESFPADVPCDRDQDPAPGLLPSESGVGRLPSDACKPRPDHSINRDVFSSAAPMSTTSMSTRYPCHTGEDPGDKC